MSGNVLECEGVTAVLGDFVALRSISLRLPQEGFLAIIGPNGAGKSTFMKALMGLVPLAEGRIDVLGAPPGRQARSAVGYIPQIKTLDRHFPALPLELVLTGVRGSWPWRVRPEERDTALEAMRRAGIEHRARVPIGKLSGGELQRVYLARAFVRRPRLILLDEPATGMDRRGEADMYSLLEKYRAAHGATIIMITHDWEAARHHASHVMLIDRQLIGFGDPAEVLNEDNMRRAFGHVGHHHGMSIIPPMEGPGRA